MIQKQNPRHQKDRHHHQKNQHHQQEVRIILGSEQNTDSVCYGWNDPHHRHHRCRIAMKL